jgi:hypothetical protein
VIKGLGIGESMPALSIVITSYNKKMILKAGYEM